MDALRVIMPALTILALIGWNIHVALEHAKIKREIDELWDVASALAGWLHDDEEMIRIAAKRLRKLEDDGK